ncbi:MAG: murein biosynthesis integral membrane protein MurJ [Firmicutes bacterium]|nr:murein biosynthesis integral membrane protein MurJ [Bacillota bacterium]
MHGKTIARATVIIALYALLSKALGFIREIALAFVFGANSTSDAYLIAVSIPEIFFTILGGALTMVVVPVFTSYLLEGRREEAMRLFATLLTLLSLALVIIILIGIPLAGTIVSVIAPGLQDATASLATVLVIVILPSILFLTLASLFYGLLNASNIFGPPAFGPVITNLFAILSIFAGLKFGISAAAVGILVGNVMAMLLQLPYLRQVGFSCRLRFDFKNPEIRRILGLMLPIMGGTGLMQIYLVMNRILASGLPEGSISALNYASKVMLLPQGIIVTALSTAIFPALSNSAASRDFASFNHTILRAAKVALLIALPLGVGLAVLRFPIIELFFARGAFNKSDVAMTAFALLCFAFGLVGHSLNPVIARGFFALQDTHTPFRIGMFTVAFNFILSLMLVRFLQHGGLALANSISITVNSLALFYLLARRIPGLAKMKNISFISGLVVASLIAGTTAMLTDVFLSGMLSGGTLALALRLSVDMLLSVGVFIGACEVIKLDEYLCLRGLTKKFLIYLVASIRVSSLRVSNQ